MHMPDGVLSSAALSVGWAVTALGTAVGLKKMDGRKIVRVSLMASAFFLASLINVKVGPSSTHLSLLAPIGFVLGWTCFPALVIALLLQALLIQFGGLLSLGVNCVDVAVPAVIAWLLFGRLVRHRNALVATISGFVAGAFAVALCAFSVRFFLMLTNPGMSGTAWAVIVAHIPFMIAEGVITGLFVAFIRKAAPELLVP